MTKPQLNKENETSEPTLDKPVTSGKKFNDEVIKKDTVLLILAFFVIIVSVAHISVAYMQTNFTHLFIEFEYKGNFLKTYGPFVHFFRPGKEMSVLLHIMLAELGFIYLLTSFFRGQTNEKSTFTYLVFVFMGFSWIIMLLIIGIFIINQGWVEPPIRYCSFLQRNTYAYSVQIEMDGKHVASYDGLLVGLINLFIHAVSRIKIKVHKSFVKYYNGTFTVFFLLCALLCTVEAINFVTTKFMIGSIALNTTITIVSSIVIICVSTLTIFKFTKLFFNNNSKVEDANPATVTSRMESV